MFNQFTGIGNLAADPDIRYSQDGKAVANFTVCCEHGYGEHKKTEFVRTVAFGKLAEVVGEYLHKGSKCMIQGAMQTRKWDNKDGVTMYTTEIVAREMKMLSPRQQGDHGQQHGDQPFPEGEMPSDVPF